MAWQKIRAGKALQCFRFYILRQSMGVGWGTALCNSMAEFGCGGDQDSLITGERLNKHSPNSHTR